MSSAYLVGKPRGSFLVRISCWSALRLIDNLVNLWFRNTLATVFYCCQVRRGRPSIIIIVLVHDFLFSL